MEKNARVEKGKTPSIHSGRPSETEKDGEAICEDEMEKDASLKDEPTPTEDAVRDASGRFLGNAYTIDHTPTGEFQLPPMYVKVGPTVINLPK